MGYFNVEVGRDTAAVSLLTQTKTVDIQSL